jgi:aminoglycoside phosphotransferase (APT) family kinase protein
VGHAGQPWKSFAVNAPATAAAQLTEEWLSDALGTEVRSVTFEPIGSGQTSSTYRLTIDADDCAPSLIAKLAHGDEDARRRVATAHRNEVGFYRQLAPFVDVPVPACRYASISDDGASFILLLEDLSPREPGRQLDGCSLAEATMAVRNLGRLHASHWNDESLMDVDFLLPLTEARAEFLAQFARTATEQFITRYAQQLDADDVVTLGAVADVLFEWQLNHRDPFSLVHGDYRLDNLMIHPAGDDVVVVDWQTVSVALPARDLSYFVGTSLPIAQRRAQEEHLVATYYEVLCAQGVTGYSFERCATDYRIGQIHGPMITVLGSFTSSGERSPQADEMFLSMARRSCAAVRDHRSIEVA